MGIVAKGKDGDVISFASIVEAAQYFGCSMPTLRYRLNTGQEYSGYIFERNKEVKVQKGKHYRIVPYETVMKKICTTPCVHHTEIKVGSVLCVKCYSHKGQDRVNQRVICSHLNI